MSQLKIRKIVHYPNEILDKKATDVKDFQGLEVLVEDMFRAMFANKGVGLAAPQVGESLNVLVTATNPNHSGVFVNPKIIYSEGTIWYREGCLSFPNLVLDTTRYGSIVVDYQDINGEPKRYVPCNVLDSVCMQHEIDHLSGVVFLDKTTPTRKVNLKKAYASKKNK